MTEKIKIEQNTPENIDSDTTRLNFFQELLLKRLYDAEKNVKEGLAEERQLSGEKNSQEYADKVLYKEALKSLDSLREELMEDERYKDYRLEFNAITEAIRTVILSEGIIQFKEYDLMEGAPGISADEIKKQEAIREDLTEGRALIRSQILQNEGKPDYLNKLLNVPRTVSQKCGFGPDWNGLEKGLIQELGVYKLLKGHLANVAPSSPDEDAHHSIDFWAETKKGKKVIFQTKSSSPFPRSGVFNEKEIGEETAYLEMDKNATVKYQGPDSLSPLVRGRKLNKDIETAKKYTESMGISDADYFLIVVKSDAFKSPTGEVKEPEMTKDIEKKMEEIANS